MRVSLNWLNEYIDLSDLSGLEWYWQEWRTVGRPEDSLEATVTFFYKLKIRRKDTRQEITFPRKDYSSMRLYTKL